MKKEVYLVHCVDTEGPLYESLEETFKRIESIYGFKIEATRENLIKLQNQQINLNGNEKAVQNLVTPQRIETNETWDQIDAMIDKITSEEFRNQLIDSAGNGWIYNWFCIDHVGFNGINPRRRDAGYHNIFNHYTRYLKRKSIEQDMIQWHYHPLPFSGNYHMCATAYVSSSNIFQILCRKIIDRMWFPAAYRPGFHAERPDSNWFLEQWIPFDYANQAVKNNDTDQPDLSDGRFGDWRKAPKEWIVYHPHHDDYQNIGNCRRWIARCLNMEARLREITIDDFRDGFKRADSGLPTLISYTNHDFRNMIPEINKIRKMIKVVSCEYPDVKFYFSNAVDAMRNVLELKPEKINLNISIEKRNVDVRISVKSERKIFGPQPFLALKTLSGQYYWDNFDFQGDNHWIYTFDENNIKFEALEKIGLAANSSEGVTEVIVYDVLNDCIKKKTYNI